MLSDIGFRLRALFRRARVEREIDEELQFHFDRQVEVHEQSGLDHAEAVRRARLEFGMVEHVKEEYRDALGLRLLDEIWRDTRLAIRDLRATPVVMLVAVASLALGIGANTAIFSLVNSLLLERLPVVEPERLVVLTSPTPIAQDRVAGWTYRTWDQLRQRVGFADGALAWSLQQRFDVSQGGEAERVDGVYVSGEFFDTLGVSAVAGRMITPADDVRGGGVDGPVVVISHSLWQRRFGGEANVIGNTLVIERTPFRIVGVTPPSFLGVEVGQTFDVVLPLGTEPLIRGPRTLLDGPGQWLRVMLRMRAGQSIDAATATLRVIQPEIRAAAMPQNAPPRVQQVFLNEPFTLVSAAGGTSTLRDRYERPLLMILAIVAVVLLVASANIANLLLARATARRHEFTVRVALGASRWRLARQLFVESLVLAGIGAGIGLALAAWGSRALVAQLSNYFDHVFLDLSLDWRVLTFTVAVSVGTAVVFGTLPALRATRVSPVDAMKEHGRVRSSDGMRPKLSGGLVVGQLALSLVVIVAAGLLVQTFQRLASSPRGFDTQRVLIVYTDMKHVDLDPPNRMSFYQRLVDAVAAVPGVTQAAVSSVTPVSGLSMTDVVNTTEKGLPERDGTVLVNYVSPGWFTTYGIPILAGRDFDTRDTSQAPRVFVVNEAFARRFFPTGGAVGAILTSAAGAAPGQLGLRQLVIGVVGNSMYRSLREELQPTVYAPLAQLAVTPSDVSISVRTAAEPHALLQRAIAASLNAVDRDLAFSFLSLEEQVNASLGQERLVAILSGSLGIVALVLAGIGVYGVTSYSVARRQTEVGILMALGATPPRIIRPTLFRVLRMVGVGIAVGIVASLWCSQFLTTLLYGLAPYDPATLAGAGAILAAVGLLAGWVPTQRLLRVDPAAILRAS